MACSCVVVSLVFIHTEAEVPAPPIARIVNSPKRYITDSPRPPISRVSGIAWLVTTTQTSSIQANLQKSLVRVVVQHMVRIVISDVVVHMERIVLRD